MANEITLTPQSMYDLFVLGSSFKWLAEPKHSWTTVDRVVRILNKAGVINRKQKPLIAKDRRTQALFLMKGRIVAPGSGDRLLDIESDPKHLLIPVHATKQIDRYRLLREKDIHLTHTT